MSDTTRFNPLRNLSQMATLISQTCGTPAEEAERRLQFELKHPGRSVAQDFAARGGNRYQPGPSMDAFYNTTDAFLYELAVWNRNRLKQGMRKWIAAHMKKVAANRPNQSLDVLSIGDGMGFDCLHWAQQGHRVTYFELPGLGEQFARRMLDRMNVQIPMLTDPSAIPTASFDALTCLDVLEHVPDVPAMVKTLASYLRPGGVMYVSAPFFLILPWYPTHLRQNRRYSGSLAPYQAAGLELIDGRPGWDPIVLRKAGGTDSKVASALGAAAVRAGSLLWLPGRVAAWPYAPLHYIRRFTNRSFD